MNDYNKLEVLMGLLFERDNPETRKKRTAADKWAIDVFI